MKSIWTVECKDYRMSRRLQPEWQQVNQPNEGKKDICTEVKANDEVCMEENDDEIYVENFHL